MEIMVCVARPDQLGEVLGVLDEAAAWLQSIGVTRQWPAFYSTNDALIAAVSAHIDLAEVFVARDGPSVIGCFRLSSEPEPRWPGEAAYLSSLAVRRAYAGRGVARSMLDWAADRAATLGKSELRLDCWAGNAKLRSFYSEAGFEWRGDIEVVSDGETVPVSEENRGERYFVSLFVRNCQLADRVLEEAEQSKQSFDRLRTNGF
ncbi:MAG TPA: GNAT family N-acetyltransferase [Dehalococcoidia bacterium]|nr:GNAT family N-acetyltransferase [Dehalococcoidia bacterium]